MIPNNRVFNGRETFEEDGKVFYRSYKIEKQGNFLLKIRVISINSMYRQAVAFSLSSTPRFTGTLRINGQQFKAEKKKTNYVIPVELPDKSEIIMELDIVEGFVRIANASDFLGDYPQLIEQISTQTGRTREQFRGNSYTSGFTAANLYGNAFWVESLSENCFRFHCNDHRMDDDFDDLVFDLEIETIPEQTGININQPEVLL